MRRLELWKSTTIPRSEIAPPETDAYPQQGHDGSRLANPFDYPNSASDPESENQAAAASTPTISVGGDARTAVKQSCQNIGM